MGLVSETDIPQAEESYFIRRPVTGVPLDTFVLKGKKYGKQSISYSIEFGEDGTP